MDTLTLPLLVLVAGLVLLVAEAFIPSGGLIGLLAVGLLGISLYLAFRQSFDLGVKFLVAEFIMIPLAVVVALQVWPRTPFAKRIFLQPPTAEEMTVSHARPRLDHLIGEYGRALTTLRPSGMVDFDGRRLDGLSEDGMIPAGAMVRAVRIQSGQLVVREGAPETSSITSEPEPESEPT